MVQQTFRNKNIYRDFDLGFSRNPFTNDVAKKTDAQAIIQSVRNLLNTNYLERPFRPEVGSNIRGLLFELADPLTISNLRSAIRETIINYEPRVNIIALNVTDNADRNAYDIELIFTLRNNTEQNRITLTLRRLR